MSWSKKNNVPFYQIMLWIRTKPTTIPAGDPRKKIFMQSTKDDEITYVIFSLKLHVSNCRRSHQWNTHTPFKLQSMIEMSDKQINKSKITF